MQPKDKQNKLKKFFNIVLFLGIFLFGFFLGQNDKKISSVGYVSKITGQNNAQKNVDFSQFWRAWEILEKNFDGQIDYQKMVEGAIRGLANSLGDPYTNFLSKEETEALESDLSGTFYGIGAEIGIKNNKLIIIAPIKNSPAERAGLKSGDNIIFINDEPTDNMSVTEAVFKIRGKEGTKVNLKILREEKLLNFEIIREKITISSVNSKILENNIGYIEITRFDENTNLELSRALDGFIAKDIKKVILDLRDNPGGYLDASVDVASQFIKSGVIVIEKKNTNTQNSYEYKANGRGKMTTKDIKIVVLVNEGTASASEIVAGALRDHNRAIIVGKKTHGKGSVQKLESLTSGAKLKITIAHWYTPNGKSIDKEGIKPDIEVEVTKEDFNKDKDTQLLKAIEILKR